MGGGRIWRRLAAGIIDILLFAVVGSLAAVALYTASGGKVRATTLLPITRCETLSAIPLDALKAAQARAPLPGVMPVAASRCVDSFLGLESGRHVLVHLAGSRGALLQVFSVVQPIDRDGRAVRPLMLNGFWPLGFILLLAGLEGWFGETPGKSVLGLKVVANDLGRLGLPRALARNLILYSAGAALTVWPIVLRETPLLQGLPAGLKTLVGLQAVALAPMVVLALASLVMLALGRPDPAYDRWVGARVVAT